jgi:hypothetical protein
VHPPRPSQSAPRRPTLGLCWPLCALACVDPPAGADASPVLCQDPSTPCAQVVSPADANPCGAELFDPSDPNAARWPERLSELGCFLSLQPLTPIPALLPYEVAAPLWSDGAEKARWISLPPGATLSYEPALPWSFPAGAMLLKAFAIDLDETDEQPATLLELRTMLRTGDGWAYASWRIDPMTGDGRRVGDQGEAELIEVQTDDGPLAMTWWYASEVGCETCHRRFAEEVLGPRAAQLDLLVPVKGGRLDQLSAWAANGWLHDLPAERPPGLPALTSDAPVEQRVRAWLDGQCAHCHRPGGFVSPDVHLDLRFDRPLAETALCAPPSHSSWGLLGDHLVHPGHPETSHLLQRLQPQQARAMPPGLQRADPVATALVSQWIEELPSCP